MSPAHTPVPLSSEDVALGQSALRLLDKRFGGKARAAIVVVLGVALLAVDVLNAFVDGADNLPGTGLTAKIVMYASTALVFLGKFTNIGTALVAPPAKVDAVAAPADAVVAAPAPAAAVAAPVVQPAPARPRGAFVDE